MSTDRHLCNTCTYLVSSEFAALCLQYVVNILTMKVSVELCPDLHQLVDSVISYWQTCMFCFILKESYPSRSPGEVDCSAWVVGEGGLGRVCPRAVCVFQRQTPWTTSSQDQLPSSYHQALAATPGKALVQWWEVLVLCEMRNIGNDWWLCLYFLQASGERVSLTIARPGKPQPGSTVREAGTQSSSQHHAQTLPYSRPSSHKVRRLLMVLNSSTLQG